MSKPYYSVEVIEKTGVQATGIFYGVKREGWLLPTGHFVDYAGYAQVAMDAAEAEQLKVQVFHQASANSYDLELKELNGIVQASSSQGDASSPAWRTTSEMAQGRANSCLQRGWMEMTVMYQSTKQAKLRREREGVPEGTFLDLPERDEIDFS